MTDEVLRDEPIRHRPWVVLICLMTCLTVPWPFIGHETTWWGPLPVWLWWTLIMTALTSLVCVWGLFRYWICQDD